MSHPYAGMQNKWKLRPWDTKFYGFNFSSETTKSGHCYMEGYDIFNIDYCYKPNSFYAVKRKVTKFEERIMKKVMEDKIRKQQIIEEKISEQQIIEDKISDKKVNDNILCLNSVGSQLTAINGGLLCTTHRESEVSRQTVSQMGAARAFFRVIREIKDQQTIEENQKSKAEEDKIKNADIARVLSEKPNSSPFNYGGTTYLVGLSLISSSLESGGTSFISTQVLTALYLGSSTSLPTSIPISTPPLLNPTSTSGGTSTGASSADNPSIFCFPSIMPLLPPRTGIGVQVSSPPPTASYGSTGVYAFTSSTSPENISDNPDNPSIFRFLSIMPMLPPRTGIGVLVSSPPPTASSGSTGVNAFTSSASPENIADNPDNPDLGFDHSGDVPDNPRKSASTFWTYISSRG